MVSRIEYLYEKKYIENSGTLYNDYRKIEKKALTLRNLQLKYDVTKNESLINRIILTINELAAEEKIPHRRTFKGII